MYTVGPSDPDGNLIIGGMVNPAGQLLLPANKSDFSDELLSLTTFEMPKLAERIEIAALAQYLTYDTISTVDVWNVVRSFHGLADNITFDRQVDPEEFLWLEPPREAFWKVLSNLQMLHDGRRPLRDEPYSDTRATRWYGECLDQLRRMLRSGALDADDTASRLPVRLQKSVEQRFSERWLASPFALGALLYNSPLTTATSQDDINKQRLALLDVLVHAVKSAILAAESFDNNAYNWLAFHWAVLRGFVSELTYDGKRSALIYKIEPTSSTFHLTCDVLEEAWQVLQLAEGEATVDWERGSGDAREKVQSTNLDTLIADFRTKVTF